MIHQQIKLNNETGFQFTIAVKKPPRLIQFSLLAIITISMLIPIVVMLAMIISRAELKIGIFFAFALFWGIGYYLFRVWSWNQHGKEIFKFENENISYLADFKYFKDGHKKIDNNEIIYQINKLIDGKETIGQLIISNENEMIESCIKFTQNKLTKLIKQLKSTHNTL